ncbi:MAG: hypothetical protein DCF15_17135, partial [Phormidesmis priestleyi]
HLDTQTSESQPLTPQPLAPQPLAPQSLSSQPFSQPLAPQPLSPQPLAPQPTASSDEPAPYTPESYSETYAPETYAPTAHPVETVTPPAPPQPSLQESEALFVPPEPEPDSRFPKAHTNDESTREAWQNSLNNEHLDQWGEKPTGTEPSFTPIPKTQVQRPTGTN